MDYSGNLSHEHAGVVSVTRLESAPEPRMLDIDCPLDLALALMPLGNKAVLQDANDELWMSSSRLRRFKLAGEAIAPQTGAEFLLGICRQPVQMRDQELFIAGQRQYSRAVFFVSVDREEMVGQWQIVLGARE